MLSKDRALENARLVKQLNLLGVAVPPPDDFDDAVEIAAAKTKEANNLLKGWIRKPKKTVKVKQQDQDDDVVNNSGEIERPRSPTQIQQEEDAKSAIDLAHRVLRALNYDYRITNMESRVQNAALSAADFAKEKLAKAMKELLHESEDSHGDLEEETNYQSAATLADAAIERVIQFYTSLDITLSDRNLLKAPPGMTTRSMPVAPGVPEFLAQSSKPNNVPPSSAVPIDAPPSGMLEVNHEEEMRDRAASSDSSSGMDRSPPSIPSQTPPFDSVGLSDTEPESYRDVSVSTDSEESSGIPYSPPPVPAVQDSIAKARRLFNDENFNKWLDNLADNAAYQAVDLGSLVKGVKNALNADVQASEWHDNLYTAVANFVYSVFNLRDDKTQQYTIKSFFELFVSSRSYTELYEPTKALFDLMKVLSDMPGGKDENISVNFKSKVQKDLEDAGINNEYFISESDVDDKVSVKDIAAAMEPAIITVESHMALKDSIAQLREAKRGVNRNSTSTRIGFEEETEQFFPEDSEFLKPEGYNKIIADPKRFHELESVDEIDPEDVEDKQVYEELKAAKPPTSILKTSPNYVPQSERDRSSSIPSLESDDDELEHESTELNATVDNGEDRLSHNVQENPTTPIPEEFWTSPHDTLAEVYLAMLGEDATKGFEDYFTREDLHERIKAFIDACETYFDSETPSADDARYLKETFDYALDPINKMIDHNTDDLEGKVWSDYRRDLKSYVAEQLADLVSNTLKHTHSRVITKEEINGAISLQRVVLAESIMSASDTVESGGGGYCGDRSIIQSVREAIRSGAISIPEDHELYAILQQTRGSIVGNEEIVSDADAKEFRRLYVNYLKRANEPYVESLMAAGISNVNLDTVGDQENVYWLTDIDMKYISKWLKVNLNVVQNVGDRDDTFSYKPEVGAESIGTINIFNQGYENQDGIHYQALLPKSRTNIKDDYVDVELEKMIASDDENSSNEFDQIPSEFGTSSDEELLEELAEEPLGMNEIAPPETKTGRGRLTAEQLAAIAAGIDPRNRHGQEAPRSTLPEEPNATVSNNPNKRRGIFSGLNRVLNNKKSSSPKTATVEPQRPARDPLQEELNQRFQEQQNALFGPSSEQHNNLTDVTPVQKDVSRAGLRKRLTSAISRESTNRVQDDSTPAPAVPTNANKRPGFVGAAPESLRATMQEDAAQQNSSEKRTPVITPPSTSRTKNSSMVVEPEDTALEPEVAEKAAFEVYEIPRPVATKSLVAMVRGILDDDNNNTGLDYVDTKIATKIEIVTKGDIPVQVATVTDRKYDDPPGKLGTVTASGVSGKDTYDAMSATLKLIAAMPDAERTAYIHPVTVRNITTPEQVIGATRALYEYCVQVSGSTLAAEQAEALKDIYINSVGADTFKQALYEFLKEMPDDVYNDAYTQSGYKAFTAGLLTSTPEVSVVTGSRGLGTHPPRTQRDPEFKPLFGLLHNYTPPKSFMGSVLSGVKRRLTGGPTDDNPKSPRVI